MLLVLDPLQTAEGRQRAGVAASANYAASDGAFEVLGKITDLLQQGRRSGRTSKPLAVAFSKIDLFWDEMAPESPLRRAEPNSRGVELRDVDDVHAQVEQLLLDWDGRRIDQFLRTNYRTFRYFGLSALGNRPTTDNGVPETGIQPYRVTDPFAWLLSQLGAIPTLRSR